MCFFLLLACGSSSGGDTTNASGSGNTGGTADTVPPTVGAGISFTAVGNNSLTVNWGAATDNQSSAANLQYRLVRAASSGAIDTIAEVDAISGGALIQDYTANDITENVTGLLSGTTYFFAVVVRDEAGNKSIYAPASQTTTGSPDSTPPTLSSSNPGDNATGVAVCSGNPCTAKISIVFSESMNTSLTQVFSAEIWNGSAYVAAPTTNTTFAWSTTTNANDTLTAQISWHWFPENSQVRYTFSTSGLQDVAGNSIASSVQRSFTTTGANQGFTIIDAGQTNCYNNSASQACPVAGFPGQDASFAGVPSLRNFSGPTQHMATTQYTTTDNATGLVWKACPEGKSGATCATGTASTMNWYNALNQCSALNLTGGYAGKTNWRLPTTRELETLSSYNAVSPALDSTNFPGTSGLVFSWSAATYVGNVANAWLVSSFNGGVNSSGTKTATTHNVRCVSSPTTISAVTYTDNGDGTVTDNATSLRWQKCSYGQTNDSSCTGSATNANWQAALQYCDSLVLGSFGNSSNWRLPNANELKSLADRTVVSPAIKGSSFPNTPASGDYWTSSTYTLTLANVFYLQASNGSLLDSDKTNTYKTRCVSTGP